MPGHRHTRRRPRAGWSGGTGRPYHAAMPSPLRPAPSRLLALAAAGALLAGACGGGGGGGDEKTAATGAKGGEGATTTTAPVPAPLTGVLLTDASVASRPAVTVKVDNSPQGRPQSGIEKADVLIEERVEGGVSRFVAVFHSEDADEIGPVRSVRSTDPGLVGALGGVFAFAGGIPAFESLVRNQPVTVVSERSSSEGFHYPAGRQRPYKTFTATTKLRSLAKGHDRPPPALFEFVPAVGAFAPAGALPAASASASYGRTSFTVDYDAASNTWKRSTDGRPHTVAGGAQLAFTNVVIQTTAYRPTSFKDPAGSQVDEAVVVGEGDAVVLSQGKQAKVHWKKSSATSVTTYTDAAGAPVKLLPGRTLVALPPAAPAVR